LYDSADGCVGRPRWPRSRRCCAHEHGDFDPVDRDSLHSRRQCRSGGRVISDLVAGIPPQRLARRHSDRSTALLRGQLSHRSTPIWDPGQVASGRTGRTTAAPTMSTKQTTPARQQPRPWVADTARSADSPGQQRTILRPAFTPRPRRPATPQATQRRSAPPATGARSAPCGDRSPSMPPILQDPATQDNCEPHAIGWAVRSACWALLHLLTTR
jgi:hypothetical protein